MAPNILSIHSSWGFLTLPSELRLQVYDGYLSECSRPDARAIHEDVLRSKHGDSTLPLLLVSKQVSGEVLDVLRKRKEYVYRITWHDAGFDSLATSCLQACNIRRDDFASIPHLMIEIYPPHPDRPTDMLHTIRSIQGLCKALRAIERLHHVSIAFIENEIVRWSTDGKLRNSMGWWQEQNGEPDIEYVLELFATLSNITKASIELPRSVSTEFSLYGLSLKEYKARFERIMMKVDPIDQEDVEVDIGILENELTEEQWDMQRATGRKSLARLKAQAKADVGIDFDHFKEIWPYIDSLGLEEYDDVAARIICNCYHGFGDTEHSSWCEIQNYWWYY